MVGRLVRVAWARALVAVLALGCLMVGTAPASADGKAGKPEKPAKPKIVWSPCYERFQCATVKAPLDYDRPRRGSISIALARLPATDPARRIGSLFLNPGGPGGSGGRLLGRGRPVPLHR